MGLCKTVSEMTAHAFSHVDAACSWRVAVRPSDEEGLKVVQSDLTCPWVRTDVSQKAAPIIRAIDQQPANAIARISLSAIFSARVTTRLPWREAGREQSRPSLVWDGHFFPCCNAPKASAYTYVDLTKNEGWEIPSARNTR